MENNSNNFLSHDTLSLKVGAFDSGIGGFSILKEVHKRLPRLEVDYIADSAFAPYGTKTRDQIIERSISNSKMLIERGAHLILVACNSATAVAIEELRRNFPNTPFVGVEPYLNALNHPSIFPGITKAGVITTVLTGKSEKFLKLKAKIDPEGTIYHRSLPHLAGYIEDLYYRGMTPMLLKQIVEEISPIKAVGLSHLILGCTHYPLIWKLIENQLGLITISPCPYVANRVYSLLLNAYPERIAALQQGEEINSFSFLSTSSGEGFNEYFFSSLKLM